MMEIEWFWHLMCACYFIGGCTIGWWWNERKLRKKGKRTGTGRWDYSNRGFKPDERYK